jgi:hypothetical protein
MTLVELTGKWTDEGSYPDANGVLIKPYDDVVLSRPIRAEKAFNQGQVIAPAGTVGTVLFFNLGPPLVVDLELNIAGDDYRFGFGFEELAKVCLHRRAEEKPRLPDRGDK